MHKRAWISVILLLVTWSTLTIRPVAAAEADDEARFVALVNTLRSSRGLAPLEVHPELVPPSRAWAAQLAADGELSHASDLSAGVTVYWTKLGENVGVGPRDQVQALFDAFVNSPGHYQNLVDPSFRYIGVGVVYDGQGRLWTTHRFMAVGEAPVTPTTAPTASPVTTSPAQTTTTVPSTIGSTPIPPNGNEPTQETSGAPDELLFADGELDADAVAQAVDGMDHAGI